MPRLNRPPAYRHHKARNLAVVHIGGKDIYLGPYGSPESQEKYARLIAKRHHSASAVATPVETELDQNATTINELILTYPSFAEQYYRKHGNPTGECNNVIAAVREMKNLYGFTTAADFGPQQLEIVRDAMVANDLARRTINGRVSRIKRVFRWGAKRGLVPPLAFHALLSVEGLKWGRSKARETSAIRPVPEVAIAKACEHLCDHLRKMVRVQELTGMRPQDIRNLRPIDIDQSQDVWIYSPWTYKTEHYGHPRKIANGPKAAHR